MMGHQTARANDSVPPTGAPRSEHVVVLPCSRELEVHRAESWVRNRTAGSPKSQEL